MDMIEVQWAEFKAFVDDRDASIQYTTIGSNYYLAALDNLFILSCTIPTDPLDPNTADFIANYQSDGNITPVPSINSTDFIAGRTVTGTFTTTPSDQCEIEVLNGTSVAFEITGGVGINIIPYGSVDGINFLWPLTAVDAVDATVTSITGNGVFNINTSGFQKIRFSGSVSSGTASAIALITLGTPKLSAYYDSFWVSSHLRDPNSGVFLEWLTSNPSGTEASIPVRNIPSGTQAVSGPLTDAQLRASPVNVSAAQSGTWNVGVTSLPGTLPLPTGAATAALQTTGNTSLSSIDGKFTTLNATDFATSFKQDVGNAELNSMDNTLTAILTSGASQAEQITGNNYLGTAVSHLNNIQTNGATAANQTTGNTRLGDVTETAPATDTASSGLNGRLQRIAQRLTSLIALFPTSLGQKTMANSLAVTMASDQSAIPSSQSGTWNINNISGTVSLPTGAATAALQTQPGVDIGDVTVNNGAGAAAVNIQDGGNSITVDGIVAATQSGTWNVTNISGTVSLPTGAATAALQTQPGVDIGDVTVNNAAGAGAVNIQDGGNTITVDGLVSNTPKIRLQSALYPDPGNFESAITEEEKVDKNRSLQVRGPVLTDEGTFRDDFVGSSIVQATLSSIGFTNAVTTMSGNFNFGFDLAVGIRYQQFIKLASDADSVYDRVRFLSPSTGLLTCVSAYAGSTGTGNASVSNWYPLTGSGGTLSVASSNLTLASGTTTDSRTYVVRNFDNPGPYTFETVVSMTQRIANQTAFFGLISTIAYSSAYLYANGTQRFGVEFTGTNNTQVNFLTGGFGTGTQSTTITLPNGAVTSSANKYKVDITSSYCALLINDALVAKHTIHTMDPYYKTYLYVNGIFNGTSPATTTSMVTDYIYVTNQNRLATQNEFTGDALIIQGSVPASEPDIGNPIKIGGIYNSALPTYISGDRTNLQTDVNGRTLIDVSSVAGTVTATGNGVVSAGVQRVSIASDNTAYNIKVEGAPATAKGTQGANGIPVQNLKDSGRNQTNFWMAIQIVSTNTDALMSLTGYKSSAAVGATTTPAVVTSGKTLRIHSITIEYTTIVTTPGGVRFTLRANTGGTVVIGSPAVCTWEVGEPTGIAPVAGKKNTVNITLPEGIEFAAGTGIGISMVGLNTVGAAAATGYGRITINGFEY